MVRVWRHRAGNPQQDGGAICPDDPSRKLVLIDPITLTRASLVHMLRSYCSDMDVSGVPDCRTGLTDPPDLILINCHAAALDDPRIQATIALVRQIVDAETPIAVIAELDEREMAINAIHRYGLRGCIPTSLKPQVAAAAVRLMLAGGTFAPLELAPASLSRLSSGEMAEIVVPKACGQAEALRLTYREAEVLRLLQHGKPNKIIAFELDIAESTVKVHMRNIMKKLRASNRTQVALLLSGTSPIALTESAVMEAD